MIDLTRSSSSDDGVLKSGGEAEQSLLEVVVLKTMEVRKMVRMVRFKMQKRTMGVNKLVTDENHMDCSATTAPPIFMLMVLLMEKKEEEEEKPSR